MKLIPVEEAVGHTLCHDITRIIKNQVKGPAFRKGHIVTAEDIPLLLSLGKEHLYVWENRPGMLHENEGAEILYRICAGQHMYPSEIKEGKVEVLAEREGLLTVDRRRLRAINALGEIMIATRHSHFPVKQGDKLAGTRVIPLVIAQEKMAQAEEIGGGAPLLTLHPFRSLRSAVITTGSEVFRGRIQDSFTPVLREKLAEYACPVLWHTLLPDDHEQITAAILRAVAAGAELVLCTGGMSVDPDDRTPLAIKNTGAHIVSYGAPVLPGAMFLLAYLNGVPVLGLPGCVMYARRTIFDLILPRLLAGLTVSGGELAALGHGGLCLDCQPCTFPNCGFGKGDCDG
jgi:molybdenum cofactor synthesis domain-containing protein